MGIKKVTLNHLGQNPFLKIMSALRLTATFDQKIAGDEDESMYLERSPKL